MSENRRYITFFFCAMLFMSCRYSYSINSDSEMKPSQLLIEHLEKQDSIILVSYKIENGSSNCRSFILPKEDSLMDFPYFDVFIFQDSNYRSKLIEKNDGLLYTLKFQFIPSERNVIHLREGESYSGTLILDFEGDFDLNLIDSIYISQTKVPEIDNDYFLNCELDSTLLSCGKILNK